jgi:outer membrane protein assembly factor BamB
VTRATSVGTVTLMAWLVASLGAHQAQPSRRADWPQWRGPARDGLLAPDAGDWPAKLSKRWELAVGSGHASPVIAGNRVIVLSRQGDREVVRALDLATGKPRWQADYQAFYTVNPAALAHGPGPKATPAVAGGRVFTFGIGGVLSAFDLASGKLLWRTPAPAALPEYGTASSPLIEGTSVIVHAGGYNNGALTAFDAAKGTPRWQWTGDGPGYGAPVIATIGGVRQVIAVTQKLIVGLSAADGKLLWQQPFTTTFNQNAVTPVVNRDVVIFSGLNKPTTAVRPRLAGSTWVVDTVWTNDQVPMFMSSPILIGGTLFGFTHRNRGQLFALDAASGKSLWTTQGREGENASLLGNRSWLVVSTTNGELVVGRPEATAFKEVRRYKIADSTVWAHPAIAGGSIVIKDADKIICWTAAGPRASVSLRALTQRVKADADPDDVDRR